MELSGISGISWNGIPRMKLRGNRKEMLIAVIAAVYNCLTIVWSGAGHRDAAAREELRLI